MAEHRMFAKTIIDSDAFLEMPLSAQALYFHLSMRGDDEGFVNKPNQIKRNIGASDDDMKLLLLKNFLIAFDTGVVVIKHWKIHNYIRKDRLKPTVYEEEREMLEVKNNGTYTLNGGYENRLSDTCPSNVSQMSVKCQSNVRISKDNIREDNISKDNIPPLSPTGGKETKPQFDPIALVEERGFEPILEDTVKEWIEYKKQKKDKYTEIGFKKLLTRIEKEVSERSVDRMIADIDMSMENNYKGIVYGLSDKKGFNQGSSSQGRLDWIDDI